MKVGEYVRTKWGCIAKFEGINEGLYEFDNIIMDESSAVREELFVDIVEKSSPNIIDLIKRFDFVNGHLVICKMYEDEKDIPTIIKCVGDYYFKEEDIKSIVTKEQFSQMEYKVNEND